MGWTGRAPARRLRAQANLRSMRHGPQSQRAWAPQFGLMALHLREILS